MGGGVEVAERIDADVSPDDLEGFAFDVYLVRQVGNGIFEGIFHVYSRNLEPIVVPYDKLALR